MNDIHKLMFKIRNLTNFKSFKDDLMKDKENWNMFCSSMDMLEDTEHAIEGYKQLKIPISLEINYLAIFGLFQAMYVQQDAIKHLHESLGYEYNMDTRLQEIRDIRNDCIGHPTKRNKDTGTSNFIGRPTITLDGFRLTLVYPDNSERTAKNIETHKYIDTQRNVIAKELSELLEKLNNKYRKL